MRISKRPNESGPAARRGAFTLLELLVVMAIMVLLAGLVLAAMGGMRDQAARKRCSNQINAIDLGLEMFFRDNGEYPISDDDPESSDEAAKKGAAILYQALSGDGNDLLGFFDSSAAVKSTGKVGSTHTAYMEQLNPQADSQGMVTDEGGLYYLNDPWREPFRYVRKDNLPPSEPGEPSEREQFQRRPATYDLYSHGEAHTGDEPEEGEAKSEKKWITNWD